MICKTYININSNLLSYKSSKELKNLQHSFHTIPLSKGTIFDKKYYFFAKKTDISKVKGVLVLKSIISETKYACAYVLNFKFLA